MNTAANVAPPPERFNETMVHLTRLPNGDVPSLWDTIAAARGCWCWSAGRGIA